MALPTFNTFTPNTTIESAKVNENFTNLSTYLDDEIEDYKNIAFKVTLAENQAIEGTAEILLFNTEAFDLGSDFDTSAYKFVVPITGYYIIGAGARLASVADQKYVQIQIRNGATEIDTRTSYMGATSNYSVSTSMLHYLAANDEITVYLTHNDSSSRNATSDYNNTVFWGYKVKL